jgi:uncharacterized membrane protein YfcA
MDWLPPIAIFVVGMAASSFGALIGGASLLTIPSLILLGLPPHTAIGTDRFGIVGIGTAGWYKFHKQGLIDYRIGFITAVPILFGSIIGSLVVFEIEPQTLKTVIIAVNLLLLVYLLLDPGIGVAKRTGPVKAHETILGAGMCFLVGIYGGFYGAAAGTFSITILLLWFRLTFIRSAATQKIGSLFMTATAAVIFGLKGSIDYRMGAALFFGCLVGSYVGAAYAERIGDRWVKRFFVLLVIVVSAKMIFS